MQITFKAKKSSKKGSKKIVRLIGEGNAITISELSEEMGVSTRAIEKQMAKLKEANLVRRVGASKSGHWEVIDRK